MKIVCCTGALVVLASTLAGCGDGTRPIELANAPTQPSLSISGTQRSPSADKVAGNADNADGRRSLKVDVLDKCDKTTFDAAIGPGTCTRPNGTLFADFIAELTATHVAHDWRNDPSSLEADVGQRVTAYNRGGEMHTFTKVAKFGGGIIPLLNQLAGTPDVAPECTNLAPTEFLSPGHKDVEEPFAAPGTVHFMCCIHPWMRTTVTVEKADDHHGDHGNKS